jgi:hypothetical protein
MHRSVGTFLRVFLVGAVMVLAACTEPRDGELKLSFRIIAQDFHSEFDAPQLLVLRDAGLWADTWSRVARQRQPLPPVPFVDFGKETVILAAMGQESSSGYTVTIEEVRIVQDHLVVSVLEKSPASGCAVLAVETAPLVVIAVPNTRKQVLFVEHAERVHCN